MNVAFFTSSLDTRNGWGRYSVNVIRELQAQGVTCTVFTEDVARPAGFMPEVVRLNSRPGSGWRNAWNIVADWYRLRARAPSFDAVHALTETHVLLAWLMRRPYVVSTHGTFALRFFHRSAIRWFAKRAFEGAATVIITSRFTEARLKEQAALRVTSFLPNGVDTDLFRQTDAARRPHSFITVGAIKPRKGQDIGIRAVHALRERFPDAHYTIAGTIDGPFYDEVRALVTELGLEENVRFEHGFSDERLVDLYNGTEVFILPSRVDKTDSFEGYPLALLEASACGLPIIGGRGCGAEHLIEEGKSGYLVTPGDVSELVSRLTDLFTDSERRMAMGRRAKAIAQELSWCKNAERLLEIYHSVATHTA